MISPEYLYLAPEGRHTRRNGVLRYGAVNTMVGFKSSQRLKTH